MTQIRIDMITGGTFPINVYIADIYGNNKTFLSVIDPGPVPPVIRYNSIIPPLFSTAPSIMLILEDSNNCEIFKILECTFGCAFEVTISLVDCLIYLTLENE
jgi:hypothetical protein